MLCDNYDYTGIPCYSEATWIVVIISRPKQGYYFKSLPEIHIYSCSRHKVHTENNENIVVDAMADLGIEVVIEYRAIN